MDILNAFNGRLAIPAGEALYVIGFSHSVSAGEKTARNKISVGTYPLPVLQVGRGHVVRVVDILDHLGIKCPHAAPVEDRAIHEQHRRRGRPRKGGRA